MDSSSYRPLEDRNVGWPRLVSTEWSPDGSRVLFAMAPAGFNAGPLFVVGERMVLLHEQLLERFTDTAQAINAGPGILSGDRVTIVAAPGERQDSAMYTVPLDGCQPTVTTLPDRSKTLAAAEIREFIVGTGRGRDDSSSAASTHLEPLEARRRSAHAECRRARSVHRRRGQDTRLAVARDGNTIAFTIKAESIRLWAYPARSCHRRGYRSRRSR